MSKHDNFVSLANVFPRFEFLGRLRLGEMCKEFTNLPGAEALAYKRNDFCGAGYEPFNIFGQGFQNGRNVPFLKVRSDTTAA